MTCPCKHKHKEKPMDEEPKQEPTPAERDAPSRTGACPFCLRKHLLAARGYAREVADGPSREWEREMLLENLILAEDHADALGERELRAAMQTARHAVEDGASPDIGALYSQFKASGAWAGANPTDGEF